MAPSGTTSYQGLESLIVYLNGGFSQLRHQLEQVELIGQDLVFVRWRLTAQHTGTFMAIPASGRNVDFNGHDLFVIKHGEITQQWHVEELLYLLNQIQ